LIRNNVMNYTTETIMSLLDNISSVIIISKEGKTIWVNKAFCKLFGYTKGEALGTGPDLVLHPEELPKMIDYKKKLVNGEISDINCETIALNKSRKKIFIEVIIKNIKLDTEDAELVEIYDITNKRKMFDSLIESERIYQYSLENTPVPTIIHSEGKIIFANSATLKLLKLKNDEAIMWKDVINFVHPDYKKQAINRIQRMRKSGKLAGLEYERFVLPDGRILDAEIFAFPIKFRGKFSYQVYLSDITEKNRHNRALKNSEQRFRLLFESLPVGIFIYDKNFICRDVNKSFENIVDAKKEDFIGMNVLDLKDSSFIQEIKKTKDGQGGFFEGRYKTTVSSKEIWVVVSTSPILDSDENFNGGIGIFTDVSKQKDLEAQFIQAQKLEAIGRLTGGIAHDFNNILTVIKGYSDLVLKATDKDSKNYKRVYEIKKAGDKASEFIQHLMAFSRKQIVKADILDVSEIVHELKGMIVGLIGEEIKFQVKVKGEIGVIFADKSQLSQVILNLLVNAKDALDEKDIPEFEKNIMIEIGEVFIDEDFVENNPGSKTGPNVSLSVMDNGIGIKQDVLDKIFEPFYTTKQSGKGTGLGLSTVYGIVKQNRGYIYAKSEPGSWTIFTTLWPVEKRKRDISLQEKKKEPVLIKNLNVLVVEDDLSVRDYIAVTLKENGFIVCEAENGILALEKIRKSGDVIDCVLTDIVMPAMDGEKLAAIIRERYPKKKIILMSRI